MAVSRSHWRRVCRGVGTWRNRSSTRLTGSSTGSDLRRATASSTASGRRSVSGGDAAGKIGHATEGRTLVGGLSRFGGYVVPASKGKSGNCEKYVR